MKKSGFSPGTTFDARYPARMSTRSMHPAHHNVARSERVPSIPNTTPSCAEQGIASAMRNVAIIFSLFVSSIRVDIVAMVPHPRPRIMGRMAFPFRPRNLNALSETTASLGR